MTDHNVVHIRVPLGPRESTPELRAALRNASVDAVRRRLAEHARISAKTWIHIGGELMDTKEAAEKDGPKVFAGLFAQSAATRADAKLYPFSQRTGYRLMTIAETLTHCVKTESLPPSWGTLYELCALSAARLTKLIESGAVHPMMTRSEAVSLAGASKKKPTKPAVEKRAYSAAKRLLLKIDNPERRVSEFLHLMRDCGISLQQLQESKK